MTFASPHPLLTRATPDVESLTARLGTRAPSVDSPWGNAQRGSAVVRPALEVVAMARAARQIDPSAARDAAQGAGAPDAAEPPAQTEGAPAEDSATSSSAEAARYTDADLSAAVEQAVAEALESAEASHAAQREAAVAEAREAARAEGHAEGHAEGRASRDDEVAALTARVAEAVAALDETLTTLRRTGQTDAVELAFALAETVVHAALVRDREVVSGLVDATLAEVPAGSAVAVRCHPEDHPVVVGRLAERREAGALASFEVQSSTGVERGGLVVQLPEGQLEGSPKRHLAALLETVRSRLEVL